MAYVQTILLLEIQENNINMTLYSRRQTQQFIVDKITLRHEEEPV